MTVNTNMTTSRRKLPRAVTRTAQDMREQGTRESGPERDTAPATAIASNGFDAASQTTRSAPDAVGASVAIAKRGISKGEQIARHAKANAIVERYSNFSVLGGVIPIPLLNVAGVTTIIVRMVKQLCKLYGVPYVPGRARALVVGVAGGAVPTTASTVATSTLVFFVPGVNLLGLAVSSVTASVCTRAIGRRFVEHFETGANLLDFPVIARR